jgi:hypothetical protein
MHRSVAARTACALAGAVLMSGCGRSVDLTDASMSEVGRALNEAVRQQPGEWETSTSLEAMDLGTGGNARADAAIRREIGKATVERGCLSPEQAATPGFGQLRGGRCRFDRFAWKGGQLDARLSCVRPDAKVSVTQGGAYTSTGFDMRTTLRQDVPNGRATSMTMHLVGRRLGDCR